MLTFGSVGWIKSPFTHVYKHHLISRVQMEQKGLRRNNSLFLLELKHPHDLWYQSPWFLVCWSLELRLGPISVPPSQPHYPVLKPYSTELYHFPEFPVCRQQIVGPLSLHSLVNQFLQEISLCLSVTHTHTHTHTPVSLYILLVLFIWRTLNNITPKHNLFWSSKTNYPGLPFPS